MASKFQTITELHGSTAKAVTATPSSWRAFFHHFPSGVPYPPGTLSSSSLSFSFSFSSLVSSAKRWGFSRGFLPPAKGFFAFVLATGTLLLKRNCFSSK